MRNETIPTPDDLTATWFTDLLRASGDLDAGTTVTTVEVAPFASGESMMSALFRATLSYDDPTEAPRTLIVKLASAHEHQRFIAGLFKFYEREVRFYHELSDRVPVRTPRCYRGEMHPTDPFFVLVLEEVGGCRQIDQVDGVDLVDARRVVNALADLHAQFWGKDLSDLAETFIPMNAPAMHEIIPAQFNGAWANARELVADDLPADIVALCDRFATISSRVLDDLIGPDTIAHCDFRVDNLLFDDDGSVVVLDFQLAAICNGLADVSYFMAQSVHHDVAGAHADELIDTYLSRLSACGIDYDRADAMRAYRAALVFFLTIPVSLLGGIDFPERGDRLGRTMLRRAAAEIIRTGTHLHYA